MKKNKDDPLPPLLPDPPEGKPLDFDDFVDLLQSKRRYAHAIHKMVMYGRKYNCEEAMRQLKDHVHINPVLGDFDLSGDFDSEHNTKCSNNTKFFMLDFTKYV